MDRKPLNLSEAVLLATTAHNGQVRKGIDEPYIVHPLRVMLYFTHQNQAHRIVAVLHDVFEDTDYTLDRFQDEYGVSPWVVEALDAITRKGRGSIGESHGSYIERLAAGAGTMGGNIAISVKLADLKDNMRDPWWCPRGMLERYTASFQRLYPVAETHQLVIP